MREVLLKVENLSVEFSSNGQSVPAVREASFELKQSEALGIVGESGSGKSTLANAIIRLLKGNGRITNGSVLLHGTDLTKLSEKEMQKVRGSKIGMIFQDPLQGLDPMMTVSAQLKELYKIHRPELSGKEIREASAELLKKTGFPNPERVLSSYAFELSGGMNQRILIAAALISSPELLICDEPTTALDVTIQEQIIGIMKKEKAERGLSMLFITHNFGVVAEICDRICVMYGGKIVEIGTAREIFNNPAHPYTRALLETSPKFGSGVNGALPTIPGAPLQPKHLPSGCPFAPRCRYAGTECRESFPKRKTVAGEHMVYCHKYPTE